MIKVELTPELCMQIHSVVNKLPREQVNALMNEFEKQLDEHNKKMAALEQKKGE